MSINDASPQATAKLKLKPIDVLTGIIVLTCVTVINYIFWIIPQREILAMKHTAQQAVAAKAAFPAGLDPVSIFMAEDKARQTLATIAGGFLVILGLFINARNLWVAERNLEVAQRRLEADQASAAKTADIANDKQLTDRFTAAVTNLGSDRIELRLGGIYALERIAAQSPRDHWTVMEVLSATVRDKRSCPENMYDIYENSDSSVLMPMPTDIQAILTVIGRRNVKQDQERILDLSATDLSGVVLNKANLSRVNLQGAFLVGVTLREVDLSGANLWGAILANSLLDKSDLSKAVLRGVRMDDTTLNETNLSEAGMYGTSLSGAHLVYAKNMIQEQLDSSFGTPRSLPSYLVKPSAPAP